MVAGVRLGTRRGPSAAENVTATAAAIAAAIDPLTTLVFVDDFIGGTATTGQIGTQSWSFAGGTVSGFLGAANHPGILRRDTSATISTLAYLRQLISTGNHPFLAAELFDLIWIFRLNVNDANTRVRIGLSGDITTDAPAVAIYLEKTLVDTQWFGTVRNASVESRTAALATVDTGWHKIRIRRIDASTVGFTFDANAEVTLATNVPATGLHPGTQIFNNEAAAKTLDHDLFVLRIPGLVR